MANGNINGNNDNIKRRKKRAQKGGGQKLRQRTAILIAVILILGFGAALTRLSFLTLVEGSSLQKKAVDQQLRDTTLTAKRGTIYDTNGNVLAESASVWMVVMAPINFKDKKEHTAEDQRKATAQGLASIFNLDYDSLYERTKRQSYYEVIKRKVEVEQRDQVQELIERLTDQYECGAVLSLLDDYKRYYPHNDLASSVIGFTGSDEQGLEGVEYQYDSYLSGTPGRIITAKNAQGTDMPFQFEQSIESEDGNNIYLTIDSNIQSICEKYMKQGIVDNNVLNRGVCIAMDVNTGAVLAMVTVDGYNLNDPYTLSAEKEAEIAKLPEKDQRDAENQALAAMWRNKAIADTYMPGSVFKMVTASMALEENKVNDNSTFFCSGGMTVADTLIHCSQRTGHGTQNFVQALCNSCNPAFMQIGQMLGVDKFVEYYQGFGFSEKTGIDLPGEAEDTFWSVDRLGEVELATASFGQNFSITPIQMITACAAVCNGGYVLKPYVVSKITDTKGNVVKTMEKNVKRQVISKATSDKLNEMLGYNTATAGATAGYVTGYKVAGKTGTSEKKGSTEHISTFDEDYISSFCGYVPADDPQIAMLVFFDTPSGSAYYGSQVASPVFINIMTEVLPYLEIKTDYSDADLEYIDVSAGDYTGLKVSEAEKAAEADGFTVTVKGDGDTVLSQIPAVSSKVSTGGNIVLYTENADMNEKITVPKLVGYSASEVNNVASAFGLNVSFSGAVSTGISSNQDIPEGTQVSPGTVITVSFNSSNTYISD